MTDGCDQILEQIEVYLDQELEDQGRCAEIKRHLDLCPPCFDRVEFRVSLRILISEKCSGEEMPEGLRERVTASVRGDEPPTTESEPPA